jgi:DNA polymerase-3 subunit alpha
MAGFTHLHNHSEYSLLDGIAKVKDIVKRCQELGFDSYALTDHGVMYGCLEFYTAMRGAGLKPLVGNEVYVARRRLTDKDPVQDRKPWHCVLLAQNAEGYRNLMHLTSLAHREGYYYKPRVDFEAISEHSAGLVCLSACPVGVVAGPFHHEGETAARMAVEKYLKLFGPERFFLEVQYHYQEMEDTFRQWAKDAAQHYGLRLVATNDCHYVHKEDARAHDIALCLRDKKLLTDSDRLRYSGPEYYIKSEQEMAALFAEYPEALANTRAVADLCNLELDLDSVHFPQFTIPVGTGLALSAAAGMGDDRDGRGQPRPEAPNSITTLADGASPVPTEDFDAYLRRLTYEGAAKRYGAVSPELRERIEYELSVIIPKGFTTYFLICSEFCKWSRAHNIPVGPGRGSAAGSVVAYALEITDLEPIKYDLYFERFLNPERIELPDFDIDFCMRGRERVIEHVKEKYGADRVALIITFMRMKARAVIKSVARTKGLEFQYVDRVTKEIQGLDPTIDEAIERSATLRGMIHTDPVIAELIEDAKRLEGIAAHHSVHAAGLVIAPGPLPDFVPVQPHKDSDLLVTQYAMDMVPKTGLVKFDFLGLRNLTMIEDTARFIREIGGEPEFDSRAMPEDDAATYAMLQRGDGYGVFQFEAPQVRKMLLDGRPENVVDLAAINAANRPGPLQSGGTTQYLEARKSGKQSEAKFRSIAKVLDSTGGVLLFQEQVMEIARQLAGYSLGEADVLRKAMGKKKLDVMEKQHERFLVGTQERGIPIAEAEAIWDMMAKFAEYGFNKAHSVCYSWISYQTAFLKCNYPPGAVPPDAHRDPAAVGQ